MIGTIFLGFIIFCLFVVFALVCVPGDTKSIHRAGYNEFVHGTERIARPSSTDSKYKYVYVTCSSDRWPCGAVLIVDTEFEAYKLNHDYVLAKYDPNRNAETAFQYGVARYTTQPYGYGFNINLYDCSCYGEVIGMRIGGRNQFFK